MDQILEKVILDFAILEFYDKYVVSRIHEDVIFEQPHLDELTDLCASFFKGRKFVYISVRQHSYNVNPMVYLSLKRVQYLSGIAIVSKETPSLNMAHFEQKFSTCPFEVFLELEEAIEWAQEKVQK